MDKLSTLRAFIAVVETRGFTQAARKTGMSKALVSKYVGQLEAALNLRLLHRTTRRVRTTSLGQAYYERCRIILEELDELDASVQLQHASPKGVLKVNAPTSFAEVCLMPALMQYNNSYPDVEIELEMTDRFVDLIEEGVDLAIRIAELPDSTMVARRLCGISLIICASQQYLEQHGEPKIPDQLAAHHCIIDTNYPIPGHWWIGSESLGKRVAVKGSIQLNSARAARELVLAGQGIGLLPSFVVKKDIEDGQLQPLFNEYGVQEHGVYAIYTHRKHLSAKVRLFIDILQKHLSNQ